VTAADIARKLGGRKSGADWIAKCPAHDDTNPSLSLRDANGKVLVRCHAGCSQSSVLAALKALGLWPEQEQRRNMIVAVYDYTDENGTLLYQVVREEPKNFKQRRPNGEGWIWKKHPHQVLYRLPEVLESPIVFVVEGEKDVETLRHHGFVATTNAGGASARWLDDYTEALRGRECVIIPDNDDPGWQRASMIAKALLGAAVRIVIVDLPNNTKDISDWFAVGHSEVELIAMMEGVHAI
jgi:5S rRNA maturation endonuclease (ribonuclease M5)